MCLDLMKRPPGVAGVGFFDDQGRRFAQLAIKGSQVPVLYCQPAQVAWRSSSHRRIKVPNAAFPTGDLTRWALRHR
jgi:hypothetical protein